MPSLQSPAIFFKAAVWMLLVPVALVGCDNSPSGKSSNSASASRRNQDSANDAVISKTVEELPDQSGAAGQMVAAGKNKNAANQDKDDQLASAGKARDEEMPDEDGGSGSADDDESVEPFVPEPDAVSEDKLLVDSAGLIRLDPDANVWVDKANHRVILAGEVCRREEVALEMFACRKGTKEHESVVSVHGKAMLVHAALLAVGAEPGHPVRFVPEYAPVEGPEVEITVVWKDEDGQLQEARAQDWVRSRQTQKALDSPFIFGGSGFWTNPQNGEKVYLAEIGELICVSNFASALMDVPIESSDHQGAELFEPFTERIPAEKTSVTLILTPHLPGDLPEGKEDKAANNTQSRETKE